MAKEKVFKIGKTRFGRTSDSKETIVEGTLDELKKYFSYTFEVGCSWNRKINRNPRTIKSFVVNLQKCYEEQEAACYSRTSVRLIND